MIMVHVNLPGCMKKVQLDFSGMTVAEPSLSDEDKKDEKKSASQALGPRMERAIFPP